jgi:hypothetical protein
VGACGEAKPALDIQAEVSIDAEPDLPVDAEVQRHLDAGRPLDGRFAAGGMPDGLKHGGYFDSTFINKAGDRIYFLHSIWSPSVLNGNATPEQCSHLESPQLAGHVSAPGLEWNTDLYYVQWEGSRWSDPINLGTSINTLGMECCMWLNDDDTEIIFNIVSDLDGDDHDGDMGLPPTGNYIATRSDRDAPWGQPVALPGKYGIEDQSAGDERADIQKMPSGNLYLWEWFANGDNLLRFGERTGGTDEAPTYAEPVTIVGSTNYETQLWVNDAETRLVFNRRETSGETGLVIRTRATRGEPWGAPAFVDTPGFADSKGANVWGEPSFDQTQEFMIFTRFDTADPVCYQPKLMFSQGDVTQGFSAPVVLN